MIYSALVLASLMQPSFSPVQERAPTLHWPIHRRLVEPGSLGHVRCLNSGKGCIILGFATSGARGVQDEALISASKELNATFGKLGMNEERKGEAYRFLDLGGQLVIARVQEGGKGAEGRASTEAEVQATLRRQAGIIDNPNARRWVRVGGVFFCFGRGGSCYTGNKLVVPNRKTPWFDETCAKATDRVNEVLAKLNQSTPKGKMLSIITIGGIPMLVWHQMGGEPKEGTPGMVTDDSDPATLYKTFQPTYLPKLPKS